MTKHHRIQHHLTWLVLGGLILVSALAAAVAYSAHSKNALVATLQKFFPAAIVGSSSVSIYDWHNYETIAHNLDPTVSAAGADQTLIKVVEEQQLLQSLRVPVSQDTFQAEASYLTSGHQTEFDDLISNYFLGSQDLFTKYLVVPETYDGLLRTYYNSQFQLNSQAYQQATNTLKAIQNGAKFEDVAMQVSSDQSSGQLGGDLGFVSDGQVLPELMTAIEAAPVGSVDPTVVVSRDGYHILYVVDTSSTNGITSWHVKHILIPTTGYDQWLSGQLSKIKVWQIMR